MIPLVDVYAGYLSQKREIDEAIQNVIDNDTFVNGKAAKEFEKNFAKFCEVKYSVGCSSGTSALHLALLALGIGKGNEVITVPNTFIATSEAISHVGGRIKLVDVKEDTGLMDIDLLEKAVTPRTKAVIVVNLFGQVPNMQRLRDLATDKNIFLVEDAAQAHGAMWNGHQPGYYSDIATYSFFPAKILGCFGDGGAVTTNNDTYAERVRLLSNHGRKTKYKHLIEGYNYRLDTIQAAILNVKLGALNSKLFARRVNALLYDRCFPNKIEEKSGAFATYYMYVLKMQNRPQFIEYMRKKGIGTGIHYPICLHLQPAYIGLCKGVFPVAEKLANEIISIPVYPELTARKLNYIMETVSCFLKQQ